MGLGFNLLFLSLWLLRMRMALIQRKIQALELAAAESAGTPIYQPVVSQ
jgi:hypothetical protein